MSTLVRCNRNCIFTLQNVDNTWISGRANIGGCFSSYFSDLFSTFDPVLPFDLADLITPMIIPADGAILDFIPTGEEIFTTVKFLGSTKLPGPDGLPALFYTAYWDIVSTEVICKVQDFFNTGCLFLSMNHTFLVLIPKVDHPFKVAHYQLISLCNVSYKIITKIIETRLKFVLPRMISAQQSTFVLGRIIQDNSILTQEIFHALSHKKGTKGGFALKIDVQGII